MLRVAHDLRGHRRLAAQRAAELTDDALGLGGRASIEMHMLAREGSASAVRAAMPVGLQRADTATQQNALEFLDMSLWGGHGLKDSPSPARLLPSNRGSTSDDPTADKRRVKTRFATI
jgi:hypothetical protein